MTNRSERSGEFPDSETAVHGDVGRHEQRKHVMKNCSIARNLGHALLVAITCTRICAAGSESFEDLDNDVSKWAIYIDPPGNQVCSSLSQLNGETPSADRRGLQFGIEPCAIATPYTGLHVYRNLSFVNVDAFILSLSFQFDAGSSQIQALEFTQSKWDGTNRWESAVQMEVVGDGTQYQGTPPTWRLWDGFRWRSFNYNQELAPNVWHKLRLFADIVDGQVRYRELVCDGVKFTLGQRYAPVRDSSPRKCAVAVQLDGDKFMSPHTVILDSVALQWFPIIREPSSDHGSHFFKFFVPDGTSCRVERTLDIGNSAWQVVTNVVGTGADVSFRDSANQSAWFYRLRSP